ncbi:MAG: cell division protein FtsA [Flavobacteriales bacterium]|nr:cell division protein FtsA [Flavobacteriales bacterium]
MEEPEIIVGLDIGTTKIACIVGRINEFGKVEIIALGKSESLGVRSGVVSNINRTVESIQRAVDMAIEQTGEEVGEVIVGIAGQHIRSLQHRGILTRKAKDCDEEISQIDIDNLIDDMQQLVMNPGEEIIHVLPQEYIVDNEQGIKDPIGMAGIRLEANFHIITGKVNAVKNIYKSVSKADLEVGDLVLEPLASSESVLSLEEKEAGVVLVDIGGGTTDIAIFQDGIIRHTAVIPFGGNIITDDIAAGCSILRKHAEQLKTKFGSALSSESMENQIVCIPGFSGREPKEISIRNLANIIQARTEEIVEQIIYEIKSSGYEKRLIAGIVLTGGGSQLKHLPQLVEYLTGLETRMGFPTEHLGKDNKADLSSPMYATGIGLVLKGYQLMQKNKKRSSGRRAPIRLGGKDKMNLFDKILSKSQEFFDSDDI